MHEAKLAKMEAEMKMVFQQKVQEKEAKLKQSEEELYARHREMKEALEKQRMDLEDKKRRIESGRPLTPDKANVSCGIHNTIMSHADGLCFPDEDEEGFPPRLILPFCLILLWFFAVDFLITLWHPLPGLGALPPFDFAIVHLRRDDFFHL